MVCYCELFGWNVVLDANDFIVIKSGWNVVLYWRYIERTAPVMLN